MKPGLDDVKNGFHNGSKYPKKRQSSPHKRHRNFMNNYTRILFLALIEFSSVFSKPMVDSTNIEEKIRSCLQKQNDKDCRNSIYYFEKNKTKQNRDILMALLYKSCELKNQLSCHKYAELKTSDMERMRLLSENCDNGFLYSCESFGYYLKKMGRLIEARLAYLKVCESQNNLLGCDEVGNLSAKINDLTELKESCDGGKGWACYALGVAYLKVGNSSDAVKLFIERCYNDNSYSDCMKAMEHYEFPDGLKPLAEQMNLCLHWMGETPYDDEREIQISKGIKENCTNLEIVFTEVKSKNREPALGIKLLSGFMKLIND